jgi:polyphosphate kinase
MAALVEDTAMSERNHANGRNGKNGKNGKNGENGHRETGKKLKNKEYLKHLGKLQAKLCMLQDWVREKGLRVIVIFEGRDAAGKGGTIKAITERVSPRVFRVIALPAPSDREKGQMYMQRYIPHFPARGEIVIFDRSWYNRAGVEHVMGFCTQPQYERFLQLAPAFERYIVEGGVILIKFWLEVSNKEQERRFRARIDDPLRQWKLSNMDLPSRAKWFDYSRARDAMMKATDTRTAPWVIVPSDDKKRARLNVISHLLEVIPHKKVDHPKVKLPKRSKKHEYDDEASLARRHFVRDYY